mgnify:CR=1 FL=1
MGKLYIVKAENVGNLSVCLTFSDNTEQTVNVGDFIVHTLCLFTKNIFAYGIIHRQKTYR